MSDKPNSAQALGEARDQFVTQWGTMGSAWGINRTMAQIHALLLTSAAPLSTDDVMAELKISRGNAHGNLRDLVAWGLVRGVVRKGERKEFFEAEKDVWRIFCIIARERARRELRPALEVLQDCVQRVEGLSGADAAAFKSKLKELREFMELTDGVIARVSQSEKNRILRLAMKLLG